MTQIIYLYFVFFLSLQISASEFKVDKSGRLTNLENHSVQNITADEKVSLPKEGSWILEPNDSVPIVLMTVKNNETINIKSISVSEVIKKEDLVESGKSLQKMLPQFMNFMSLLNRKNLKEAETELNSLQNMYPQVSFFNFSRASLEILKGNKQEAIRYLQIGLKEYPDYQPGKEALHKLRGASND